MSTAVNKAGLSPTSLGLTGLESINSSQESQDAREKPSMRKREIALNGWRITLKELFNRYLQVRDYIAGKTEVLDYSDLIQIRFNEYTNPTVENITDVLSKQIAAGLKSKFTAIKELHKDMTDEEAEEELMRILAEQGVPVVDEGEDAEGVSNANVEGENENVFSFDDEENLPDLFQED